MLMKLSIITINYNNAAGLQKTIESVLNQTSTDFEYIIMDGGSVDSSCRVITDKGLVINGQTEFNGISVTCVSEPDAGIYNAMNKGIRLAKGEYVQFLNSGDALVNPTITTQLLNALPAGCDIFYGNMLKPLSERIYRDCGLAGRKPTLFDFYKGTLNHSSAYIKRGLFDIYGLYDEKLKIVSDWKWYLQVIALGTIVPVYIDMDITVFDMHGISSTNPELEKQERRLVLEELIPSGILSDYDLYSEGIETSLRINKYIFSKRIVWFIDRVLFKLDEIKNTKKYRAE